MGCQFEIAIVACFNEHTQTHTHTQEHVVSVVHLKDGVTECLRNLPRIAS